MFYRTIDDIFCKLFLYFTLCNISLPVFNMRFFFFIDSVSLKILLIICSSYCPRSCGISVFLPFSSVQFVRFFISPF